MRAEILTIGDELCRGEIIDTNSAYLAERLWDLDITTRWMTSCTDHEADIVAALSQAVTRSDLVICSGGLGPTEDDLTVDVVARLGGASVELHEPSRRRLEERFAGRVEVTPIQLRQVRVPAGSLVHGNPVGLAPCFELPIDGVPVICLPGFPREIHGIFDQSLGRRLAELREARGAVERIARRIYRVFGRGESQISQACRGLFEPEAPGPRTTIHYQVKFPEVLVKLVVRDRELDAAHRRLAELDAGLCERLGPALYGTGDETLIERVARRLLDAEATVATAESCTGGMLGEMLTRVPGSSRAYTGGAIVYSNDEKVRQLGVLAETLAAHGAVSEPTVVEMARGALARFGTRFSISVSGVAGPDGGTPEKPVGTVWLALASRGEGGEPSVATRKLSWPSTRDQIRILSAWWALAMLDAALPAQDAAEAARSRWVLGEAGGGRP
ncbi:MAG TPA: CinA family nicotinamide mononucleotide deamidase-related protein [Kofleriaceae bacterium]|nr:CinA family nicotinamide mononucleotide deamidase-related protein [Kofleriaceae bacterium]